ncbi:hypothetical protein IQ238_27390 [Pleurocapsales cyanobacterium LEGE 06147]|nr:hypothetical protein [Pleurocapsales cyanobacterium LEGE 06147]
MAQAKQELVIEESQTKNEPKIYTELIYGLNDRSKVAEAILVAIQHVNNKYLRMEQFLLV